MRVVKVQSWMRSHFTPAELSGWSTWVDVAGSLSEQEAERLARAKKRAAKAARRCVSVTPMKVGVILN